MSNIIKCGRCSFLNTFSCEHSTPVRNDLSAQYLEQGRFFLQPKKQSRQPNKHMVKQNFNQKYLISFFVNTFSLRNYFLQNFLFKKKNSKLKSSDDSIFIEMSTQNNKRFDQLKSVQCSRCKQMSVFLCEHSTEVI